MTTGAEIFGAALTDIFNSPIGDDATYTPYGGAAVSLRVIIDKSVLLQPAGDAQVYERGVTIEVILDDISNAEPNRGSTFVVGSETFTVQSILENDGLTAVCVVK